MVRIRRISRRLKWELFILTFWACCILIYTSSNCSPHIPDSKMGPRGAMPAMNGAFLPGPARLPDVQATGVDDFGHGLRLDDSNLTVRQKALVKEGWTLHAYNQYVSDQISVKRTLPHVAHANCANRINNAGTLPNATVIICFHNEAWSVLLRTVHSVLDRTPPELIQEILLVDDFSDMAHLKAPLDAYINKLEKVKILRSGKRNGLIRSRLKGARSAGGKVLIFLDSHCECTPGWIEPLLHRIQTDPRTIACPNIDSIKPDTFRYHKVEEIFVGGFDWFMRFNWHVLSSTVKKKHADPTDPVESPTMAGGLFAVDKHFFHHLGSYDPGLDIWGAENLELSFKTWMCGGRLEMVPCSRVGHIFRQRSPYKKRKGVDTFKRNSIRVAEVWMDEYKYYYYERINYRIGDFGNVSSRTELRKNLHCRSFKWYLDNVYPDRTLPPPSTHYGELRSHANTGETCLDSGGGKNNKKPLVTAKCTGKGGNQYWTFSIGKEIRRDDYCLAYKKEAMILAKCDKSINQQWSYDHDKKQLMHTRTKSCLQMNEKANVGERLILRACSEKNIYQHWTFQYKRKKENILKSG